MIKRLDIKIVLILMVTMLVPLGVSVYLVLKAIDTSLGLGINKELTAELEDSLEIRRQHIRQLKRNMGQCFTHLTDSYELISAASFGDEKTLLGVGQAQVRQQHSVESVPAVAVAAYSMLLTSAINAYGPTAKPDALPSPKWRRKKGLRASTQSLLQHLRHEVWAKAIHFSSFPSHSPPNLTPEKLDIPLDTALFYATV